MCAHLSFAALVLSLICTFTAGVHPDTSAVRVNNARSMLSVYNGEAATELSNLMTLFWNYFINMTDHNQKLMIEGESRHANFSTAFWEQLSKFSWQDFQDPDIRRQFWILQGMGSTKLNDTEFKQMTATLTEMEQIYSTTQVCSYSKPDRCDLNLEPDLQDLFSKSGDVAELKYLWMQWHNKVGKPMRPLYPLYVKFINKAARINGFKDAGEMYRNNYESPTFSDDLRELWEQLKPLYQQLHAYIRRRLINNYGPDSIPPDGPIPAHLIGTISGAHAMNILKKTLPFPNKNINFEQEMIKQNYTVKKMFKLADEFFVSLGLDQMSEKFWNRSVLERIPDVQMGCHPTAWDFMNESDFRIRMCARVNSVDFTTIHHEMGHIHYFMQYSKLPFVYRAGANNGFQEAVGDTIGLSVRALAHLQKIGLIQSDIDDPEEDINHLYSMALDKIAFLPFGYLLDLWQWQVYGGKITEKEYNSKWWDLRFEYQGFSPPVPRTEQHFDPGALYHVATGSEYIMYFIATIIQFQFHKGLCEEAGQYRPGEIDSIPLHKCDIYESKAAGLLLSKMLMLGRSKPWPEAMRIITRGRTDKIDTGAIKEFFQPLMEYLEKENQRNQEYIGWIKSAATTLSKLDLSVLKYSIVLTYLYKLLNFL